MFCDHGPVIFTVTGLHSYFAQWYGPYLAYDLALEIFRITHSFVYRRWRSHVQVKISADPLFVVCKLPYFDSTTTEQLLIISLQNFVSIKKTPVIMSWISKFQLNSSAELKFHGNLWTCFEKSAACGAVSAVAAGSSLECLVERIT